jgi:hypothetical protein
VLVYTQADVECDLYMEILKAFEVVGKSYDYVLKVKKSVFGKNRQEEFGINIWFTS